MCLSQWHHWCFKDLLQRLHASQRYREHISQVVRDRTLETRLVNDGGKAVLVVHWDGMDQAKWSVPRVSKTTSKTFSGFDRPRLKVQGVWLHHYSLQFFVLDPRLHSGGSAICDCAARALEAMVVECRRRNVDLPRDICIWSDNTVKENKNQTVLSFLSWLVGSGKFQCASLNCAMTGHTHNQLDQIYGLLAVAFRYTEKLSDPIDVTAQIKQLMTRLNLQQWLGSDTAIDVHYVRSIYNWKSWSTCFQLD